jgi:hypothetical protein
MTILGLLIGLFLWNWLGGLAAGLVFGPIIVAPFLVRFNKDPENFAKARAYCRAVGTNHLVNHLITIIGSAVMCAASTVDGNVPTWLAWGIFSLYFLFTRLSHILDAAHKMITGAGLPDAAYM